MTDIDNMHNTYNAEQAWLGKFCAPTFHSGSVLNRTKAMRSVSSGPKTGGIPFA